MNRPYSFSELDDIKKSIYAKHRLSDKIITHIPCLHKYHVKKGGRKEQQILDSELIFDDQTCSVCFKLRTTENIPSIISVDESTSLSRSYLENVDNFYKWLYRHEYS